MNQNFKYSTHVIMYPLLMVFTLWLVFWFQVRVYSGIRNYGIHPKEIEGLFGIVTSPFLHSNITHLFHNSVPLLVLTMALFYFYNKIAWRVLLFGVIGSGLLTWTIAKTGNHIGASGLIYVLVSFMFFKGIFAKHFRLVALSLLVVFLYGSMIWYVFPIKDGMSWEGHLSGLITGLIFALVFRKSIAKPEKYKWEEPAYNEDDDPFMKHFDSNGNFIELPQDDDIGATHDSDTSNIDITYHYKKSQE